MDARNATTLPQAPAPPRPAQAPPGRVEVAHTGGESYSITVRDHTLTADQPVRDGGTDRGPTPTELFVASLASCVAYYAGRFLSRHGAARDGLRVTADFGLAADRPARVAAVRLRVAAPGLPAERRPAFLAVISRCTVHNTLHQPPEVVVELTGADA
ncbi:OsmC family protein [Actinomadura sp. ATCC 31491]|uniref:OsmC family protein n=1 Tax=Actinomadura luzonensis TaxID=2805427 RepID=A0ABT0G309_9ACTN|nr:OsmC family protein [Actinomadura luzonensis]MCK2218991.1 OsmC family protein [Actinomadura luzonensis]